MNLIETLKLETESLRKQYLKMTKEWAIKQLTRNMERYSKYIKSMKKDYDSVEEYYKEQKFYHYSPAWYFTPLFIDKMLEEAEEHYEDSIVKLANRIERKDLNIEKLNVKTSHIGVNIDTVLTDGEKIVKAWTIIASGPIQKPHYRYLIK